MIDRSHRFVVLGGVGADSHSVGLIVLRRALASAGFTVVYLSTQNSVTEFCEQAAQSDADAVLLSNMDGHAGYYLRDLPGQRALHGLTDAVWYLGGHPCLAGSEAQLDGLGFDRVFLEYVDPSTVIAWLDRDLAGSADPRVRVRAQVASQAARPGPAQPTLTYESFDAQREAVLRQWWTGHQARQLEQNAVALAAGTLLFDVQRSVDGRGRPLIHPRTGVAGVQEQAELFSALQAAGADVLSFQIDSLTRNNNHEQVELLLKESTAELDTFHGLNGFPLVNHGVSAGRAITSEFPATPFQVRHSTRDPRLLAEIAYASGISAYEGGALTYNLPYYRDYAPRESVLRWRYVDELTARYYRRWGIVIDREFFGVLTATMIPASIAVTACVLEALLAAEAGVRSVSLGYAEQGNRGQDIGAARALRLLGRRYLDRHGYHDVAVFTVFHQYMAAFPQDQEKARMLLRGSAETARLSGVTRLMLKTMVESVRIPSADHNLESLALVRSVLDGVGPAAVPESAAMEEELIVREASAMLDAVLDLDPVDLGDRVAMAVERGLVDVPYSPNVWNAGRAMPIRDCAGAVRFADFGGLPIPKDVQRFHRDAVRQRLRRDGGDADVIIERDLLRTARGDFDVWPLAD